MQQNAALGSGPRFIAGQYLVYSPLIHLQPHSPMTLRRYLLVSLLALCADSASAQARGGTPKQPPKDTTDLVLAFGTESKAELEFCALMIEAREMVPSTEKPCMPDAPADRKIAYQKASARLTKKPEALKLFKEYYALWVSAFSSMEPKFGELKSVYQQRRSATMSKLEDAWARFQIEAGY